MTTKILAMTKEEEMKEEMRSSDLNVIAFKNPAGKAGFLLLLIHFNLLLLFSLWFNLWRPSSP